MDPLDYLEKRIEALELQILPKNTNINHDDNTQQITNLLLQTQTMISSALSCRESVTSVLQHVTTINEYLDPCNGENELEVEAKRHYLLELYPELKDTVKMIPTLEHLTCYLDSSGIMKVTELSEKLENLAASNLEIFEMSQEITQKTVVALQKYSDIISSIKVLFSLLDQAITDLEVALLPKFVAEE